MRKSLKNCENLDYRHRMITHAGSGSELMADFEQYGFLRSGVCEALGGSLKLDHATWLEQRRKYEAECVEKL